MMKKLLILDEKDYTEDMPLYEKYAVRGIIKKGNSFAMQRSRDGEYKIPGGGLEEGESFHQALIREILEETGLSVIPESIVEIGEIEEIRRDKKCREQKYICHSLYYKCEVFNEAFPTSLSDNEKEMGYLLEWATLDEIYDCNTNLYNGGSISRDTQFIKLIREEKL